MQRIFRNEKVSFKLKHSGQLKIRLYSVGKGNGRGQRERSRGIIYNTIWDTGNPKVVKR